MPAFVTRLCNADGRIGRLAFSTAGLILFFAKYVIDWNVAYWLFDESWPITGYLAPMTAITSIDSIECLMTLLMLSLPFAWVGAVLCVQRLRAADMPLWLAGLFFLPLINLVLITLLCTAPSCAAPQDLDREDTTLPPRAIGRWIPHGNWSSAALAAAVTCVVGLGATALGVEVFASYGWGLFVALPFCLGLFSTLIYAYHYQRSFKSCVTVGQCAVVMTGPAMLIMGLEGLICIIMSVPIWCPSALVGSALGYLIQITPVRSEKATSLLLAVLTATPLLLAADAASAVRPPLRQVRTVIDVQAPPQRVWDQVIAFPKLPPPSAWLFRLGIAYPTEAHIEGRGPDAVRHCVFSTGAFVEPIAVWDEPRLLSFTVTDNPPPMRELTFHDDIHPPHLDGFLASEAGQFRLQTLANGATRLEGTTWYRNDMWPQAYWGLWSDWIIHRIHLRVLTHIQQLSETTT